MISIQDNGKTWVVIQINTLGAQFDIGPRGALQFWQCRGNVAWDSPGYNVLGYVKGYYHQVSQYVNTLPANPQPWDKDVHVGG
jgi:hypothetical protein